MTTMPLDDTTYAVEIGIDAEEQELGVIGGRYIAWKRLHVYAYEMACGAIVTGLASTRHGPNNRDVGRAISRRNALNQIAKLRESGKIAPAPISTRAASPAHADGALTP